MVKNKLPSVLFVGPTKAGTSWVHDYLKYRGDVCLPGIGKETFFFDQFYSRGLSWYEALFDFESNKHVFSCEVCPTLFHKSNKIAEIVRKDLGDITIVITLREPVERSWSDYLHLRRYGYTNKELIEVVNNYPSILENSMYDFHLPIWREHFTNVVVLYMEDLKDTPEDYVKEICSAMSIAYISPGMLSSRRVNQASIPPSYWLARSVRVGAKILRKSGLEKLISKLKKTGIHRIVFNGRKKGARLIASQCDRDYLESKLQSVVSKYQKKNF